ncbi:sulfate/molybdate ABC transporter ATP-binding protein [Mycolicibacterium psychrotolerans]|uniref:Molybdenum ABC transporter ATP-binding protein n=3 Tax=Mycolicibacterium psychrotolerans TaxID=216929 RepID=A0A7I7MFQ4_9MYCO|nr:ATP-binding cassette domain-containing protein [Mycolicibacterium psychrotolerans]BBX70702.1 molybdenum ABC transporter ATP-binding protein [Mycolicibacterium psychrotolerans]
MSSVHVAARLRQRAIDVDIAVEDGQVLAVLGPNGVGKSTLLQIVAGLVRPDSGRVQIGDDIVTDTHTGAFVPAHARGVALLAQQAMLFPHLSVGANVAYAPRCRGLSRAAAREQARRWLDAVGASELAGRRPAQLSGGQAQRVAVARALAAEPRVLLLDEPFAALDVTAAPALRRLLRDLLRDRSRTAIVVTHDMLDALALADTAVILEGGRVAERGPVRSVLSAPRSDFGARIAGVNLISGVISERGSLRTPWGADISGLGDAEPGVAAVALFRPSAVAVHLEPPHGSPRNVLAVTLADVDVRGPVVRVRGGELPDGASGLAADVSAAAAVDLGLEPGRTVYFAIKAQEVGLHPAHGMR